MMARNQKHTGDRDELVEKISKQISHIVHIYIYSIALRQPVFYYSLACSFSTSTSAHVCLN